MASLSTFVAANLYFVAHGGWVDIETDMPRADQNIAVGYYDGSIYLLYVVKCVPTPFVSQFYIFTLFHSISNHINKQMIHRPF